MRVLIGYSRCPITVGLLRARGVEAWTCDLLPAEHEWHVQCDVWHIADGGWDWALFHPMCTYLTCSAAWAFTDGPYHMRLKPGTLTGQARRDAREEALANFRRLLALPYPKAIENPAPSFVSKAIRPPSQTIQPYQFGDDASKRTGLWLDRLPMLQPLPEAQWAKPRLIQYRGSTVKRWSNQAPCGAPHLSPSDDRWLTRSKTFPGIARAIAEQWGAR